MAWRLPEAYAVVSRDYEADARHELQTAIEETLGPDQRSRVTRSTEGRAAVVVVSRWPALQTRRALERLHQTGRSP